MKTNKKNLNAIIIICTVAIFLILGAILTNGFQIQNTQTLNKDMIEIPRIYASVQSENGDTHNITADFYVNSKDKSSLTAEQLQTVISKTIQETDYEAIHKKDGLKELTSAIQENLNQMYPDSEVKGVYADTFIIDYKLPESTETSLEKTLKGLQFK